MKLLIITQKVDADDPILGFFHRWIQEFAKHCESIVVICLYEGKHDLPDNVRVLSLGKEKSVSRLQYIWNFYKYIWNERKNYDKVFVHMNPIYVILGGVCWRLAGKKISLWYTHKHVDLKLRVAEKIAHAIFSASKESFRLPSRKLRIVGHGIDVERFKASSIPHSNFTIISVGRITKIKNLETLIWAAKIISEKGMNFDYLVIGPVINILDKNYFLELNKIIKDNNLTSNFHFIDAVPNSKIVDYFAKSDLNINLTPPGGIDKVVLEGLVSGVIPLVSNSSFSDIFGDFSKDLIFQYNNSEDLAEKIISLYKLGERKNILDPLQKRVQKDYNLVDFTLRIINGL